MFTTNRGVAFLSLLLFLSSLFLPILGGCEIIASPDAVHNTGTGGAGGGDTSSVGGGGSDGSGGDAAAGGGGNTCTPPEEIDGDCKLVVCDETGSLQSTTDNNDVFVDGDECTDDVCVGGSPSNPPSAQGSPCGNGLTCNGAGDCTGCTAPEQCPGADEECKTRTCTGDLCGFEFVPQGTRVTTQVAGDCNVGQCDGAGNVEHVPDNTDLPNDNNGCTGDECINGVPSYPPKALGTSCGENGSLECDGSGQCVGCNAATDCPGFDDECQQRTCSNTGVCGFDYAADGTVVAMQTANDCLINKCNGSGGTIGVFDDNDTPPDDGVECTGAAQCSAGTPAYPPVLKGTPCSQNAGETCDGAGLCVGPCGPVPAVGDYVCAVWALWPGNPTPPPTSVVGLSGAIVPQNGNVCPLWNDPLNGNNGICQASDPSLDWVMCDLGAMSSGSFVQFRVHRQNPGIGIVAGTNTADAVGFIGRAIAYHNQTILGAAEPGSPPIMTGPVSFVSHQPCSPGVNDLKVIFP